ncbi:MAG: hypothetical protein ACT4PM_12730 [Gemmatimonadales bacterium]
MRTRALPMLSLLAGLAFPAGASAQVIDYTKVRQYVGEEVTVEGPVARAERGTGGTLRFHIGKTYGRRTLVVVVPAEFVTAFDPDLRSYEGKTIQVRGRISTGEAEGLKAAGEGTSTVPAIVLQDSSRFKVVTTTPDKKPDSA